MTTYSKELIARTIKYFAEKHDHHISEETAQEYLESFAGLYLAFSDMAQSKTDKTDASNS